MTSLIRGQTPDAVLKARELGALYGVRVEPPPTKNTDGVPCWTLALQAIYAYVREPAFLLAAGEARNNVGIARYGTPLMTHNGRDMRVDGLQEALDGIAYTTGALREATNEGQRMYLRHAQIYLMIAAELLSLALCDAPPTDTHATEAANA